MINTMLGDKAPEDLVMFVSSCASGDDLVKKLEKHPSQLLSFIEHLKIEGNEELASKLSRSLLNPKDLDNPEVKKVETALRNRGLLNRAVEPDLKLSVEGSKDIEAHKTILALESPYFKGMRGFSEFQKGQLVIKGMEEISIDACRLVVDYLYLSDEKRKKFTANVDKSHLLEMAKLTEMWQIEELKLACDEELCNSIGELAIKKNDLKEWLSQSSLIPKFALLLDFIAKQAGDGDLDPIIEQMQTPAGAALLASKCTPQEIAAFATLKTEFGNAFQIPPGTFGKAEWEKAFPVTIKEVPPLPANIHAILELEDPCEPGKKLKETCQLFLRPEKVILHEKEGNKELLLSFNGVEELAQKATSPQRRTRYRTFDALRNPMNALSVATSGWVLMRKEVIPGSGNQNFEAQKGLLKGGYQVPQLMDAVLLNILTYAREGKCLYGQEPWTYTRCQELCQGFPTLVGGFGPWPLPPPELQVSHSHGADHGDSYGLSGCWKF